MEIYTASQARAGLYNLIDHVAAIHEPICVKGKRHKVILMAEEDYKAIEETLFLLSIQGMRGSIIEGRNQPLDTCVDEDELEW